MTMTNLFSIFDPSTTSSLSLNWVSGFVPLLLPSFFWLTMSKSSEVLSLLFKFLSQELKAVLNLGFSGSMRWTLISLFFYVWLNNLIGLLPYVFTSTSHLSVTLSLAVPLWVGYMVINLKNNPSSVLAHLVPKGTPPVLVPFMVLIELISNFMRPMTLGIRLAANMVAGHLLLVLVSGPMPSLGILFLSIAFLGVFMLMVLELSVSFIQGYVFMTLSSLYLSEINNPNN